MILKTVSNGRKLVTKVVITFDYFSTQAILWARGQKSDCFFNTFVWDILYLSKIEAVIFEISNVSTQAPETGQNLFSMTTIWKKRN